MYRVARENVFLRDKEKGLAHDLFRSSVRVEGEKVQGRRDLRWDYVKYYKVFIYFSIHLSINLPMDRQIVHFRQ